MGEFGPSPEIYEPIKSNEKIDQIKDQAEAVSPQIREFMLKGRSLEFIGVYHGINTLKEFEGTLKEHITTGDVIVVEAIPRKNKKLESITEQTFRNKGIPVELYHLYKSGEAFYNGIADIVHDNKKTICSIDPHDPYRSDEEGGLNIEKADEKSLDYEIKALLAVGGFLGADILYGRKQKQGREKETGVKEPPISPMTRREFLKTGLKYGAAIMATTPLISRIQDYETETYGKIPSAGTQRAASTVAHSLMDYRNVVVAEGLNRLLERFPDKKIKIVYGLAHSEPVIFYAQNDLLRKAKLAQYGDFERVADPRVKVFIPSEKTGVEWQKTYEEDIK